MHGNKRVLWGQENYERYRDPRSRLINPSDVDDIFFFDGTGGEAHHQGLGAMYDSRASEKRRVGARRLAVEIKGWHEDPSLRGTYADHRGPLYDLMGGQLEMLESFSAAPNQQAVIVWDPYVDDCSNERMDPNVTMNFQIVRDGRVSKVVRTNIGFHGAALFEWQWNKGMFKQPYFDHEMVLKAEIAKAVAAGTKLEELDVDGLIKTLRLPTFRQS